ncbi:MAG: cation transporter [Lentisphaerae bacterium]|nr:cation transporter [Lentisphaerota bacterium]
MLTEIILSAAVPGYKKNLTPEMRIKCGIAGGITGIVCNVFLAIVKFTLAVISGSVAAGADAVNNLSDAGTGLITVSGFRLSSRAPDAEHPFGHGRTEYVAALIVALLVMGLGVTFLKDSIVSLFRSSDAEFSKAAIIIFSSTILVKCWLFFFYRKLAGLIKSDMLKAASYDSLSDCLGTLIVVGAMIGSKYTVFPLDGWAGIVVAGMIFWAGGGVLKDTISKLLGEQPDKELVEKLKSVILSIDGIDGVHDIIIHNYGGNSYYVTAHAEISSTGNRLSAHDILENAEVEVAKQLPVHLLLHGDPYNKSNPEVIFWRSRMENCAAELDSELKIYDFRLIKDDSGAVCALSFHLLVPHRYALSETELLEKLESCMQNHKAGLKLMITFQKSFI